MYVCVCFGITDKQISNAVVENGVGNLRDLRRELGVAGMCGKCTTIAQAVIDDAIIDESLFKDVG